MKSYNVDKFLLSKPLIEVAIRKVCKDKKKKPKGNNKSYYKAQKILNNIDYYVNDLYKLIYGFELKYCQNKNVEYFYQPKCDRHFTVDEGSHRKTREIVSAPLYPDQMVHQLLISLIHDIYKPTLYQHSCGSIKGKGNHYGVKYVKNIISKHKKHNPTEIKYVFKGDIRKCYASFDHNYIKSVFRKKLKGKLAYRLLCVIIDTHHDSIDKSGNKSGIPIGFATSQYICNICLTPLDNFIKHEIKVKYYIRYMDDIVFFGRNKKEAHKRVKRINSFLKKIGMKLKNNWQVFRFDYIDKYEKRRGRDIDFLGYRFFRDKTILRKDLSLRIKRQARRINKRDSYNINMCRSFVSRIGWLKHCDSIYFMDKYIWSLVDVEQVKQFISYYDKGVVKCLV